MWYINTDICKCIAMFSQQTATNSEHVKMYLSEGLTRKAKYAALYLTGFMWLATLSILTYPLESTYLLWKSKTLMRFNKKIYSIYC